MNNTEFLKSYIDELQLLGRSALTCRKYIDEISAFNRSINKSFLQVNRQDMVSFISSRNSSNSKVLTQTVLVSFFNWMVNNGHISSNPLNKRLVISKAKRLSNVMDQELLGKITNYMRNNFAIRDMIMVMLKFGTGIRSEELLNINVEDLDLCNNSLTVIGKGNKERKVYFNDDIKKQLNLYVICNKTNNGLLFRTKTGKKIHTTHLQRLFNTIKQEFGLEKFNPHFSRHCFASWASNNGMSVSGLQKLLGHENINTTLRYLHRDQESLKNEVIKNVNW